MAEQASSRRGVASFGLRSHFRGFLPKGLVLGNARHTSHNCQSHDYNAQAQQQECPSLISTLSIVAVGLSVQPEVLDIVVAVLVTVVPQAVEEVGK